MLNSIAFHCIALDWIALYSCYHHNNGIPSGKRSHNYGKSSFSMGKSTSLPEGNNHGNKAMMIYPRCSESYVWDTNDSARLSFGI